MIVIAGVIAFVSKGHTENAMQYFIALVFLVLFFFFMTNSGDSVDEDFKVDLNTKIKRRKKRRRRK